MIRPLELFVGLRYVRARRRDHFISFISLVSIVGIALGIAALITVLSVMNGFGKELRSRILGVASHVTITGAQERLTDWKAAVTKARENPHVKGEAPFVRGQAMLARGKSVSPALVHGVLPEEERKVSEVADKMLEGSMAALKPGEFGVVIGSALAWKLDLSVGSPVSIVVPQAQASPAGLLPRFKRFTVVGIFRMDMYEYDSGMVFTHLDDAAKLYQLPEGSVTGLRLKLDVLDDAPIVAEQIGSALGPEYRVRDWTREHSNFFRALKMEKTVMFVILLLIVTVAMFNLISTLVVIVTEKQADVAILRTLGMKPGSIMGVFIVQGALIGFAGTLVGVAFGVLLAFNVESLVRLLEQIFQTTFLASDVYLISELPSDVHWSDVGLIAASSLILALLSTLYPAWRASKIQPAVALRYE